MLTGACVAVAVAATSGFAVWTPDPSATDRSRAASDAPCTRAYVQLPAERGVPGALMLDRVMTADEPTAIAVDPRRPGRAVLAERAGQVVTVDDEGAKGEVVLDLDDTSQEGDGGLLGLTFDTAGDWLYVYRTTRDQDDVITAYPVGRDGRPDQRDEQLIIRSGHPRSEQHHGGGLAFGPDGYLYVAFGDGGGLGDPAGNAQRTDTLLGKILRIRPTPDGPNPYEIPPDNPYRDQPGWRPEIWLLGVRNPFRMTFDAETGDLWLGDVGQSCWEELNRSGADDAGSNLGWDRREGTAEFEPGDIPGRALWPEQTYAHRDGWCAIVAGVVVRDARLADLDGWLLHTDYCRGRLMALWAPRTQPRRLVDLGVRVERPTAIAIGPDGFPWVLSAEGDVLRLRPGST